MKKTFLTAVSATVIGLAATGASANPDMQAKIDALAARVHELEAQQKDMGPLTEKEAVTTKTNNNLVISGHVNRAALWLDNGKNSNVTHVDNDNSSTRLNIKTTGALTSDMTVGAELEVEFESNTSGSIDVKKSNDQNDRIQIRKADVFFKSKRFGTATWGEGKMASDGVMEATDLSGTLVAAEGASAASETAGGLLFFDTVGQAKSSFSVVNVFESADGLSREDRIRYDTPSFFGFTLGASHGHKNDGDEWDVALKYAGEISGTKIAFQAAYAEDKTRSGNGGNVLSNVLGVPSTVDPVITTRNFEQFNVSAGVLFPFGLSLMVAYAHKDYDQTNARDGEVLFGKIGYQQKFIEAGKTCFAIDFGQYENMNFITDFKVEGKSYGFSIVQNLDRVATEVYLNVRRYELDNIRGRSERFDDATSVMFGARVKL